jgi:DNA polymerase zeta
VLAPPTQADTQGSSPGESQEDEIRTCSPRYDEGIGFAEMAGISATQGNSIGRLGAPKLPISTQGSDSSTTGSSPPSESENLPTPASSTRRKSVQFTESPDSSVASAPELSTGSGGQQTRRGSDVSQVSAVTQRTQRMSQIGFNSNTHGVAKHATQHLVVYSVEVHVQTRAQLLPDPCADEIGAICYVIRHETLHQEQGPDYRDIVGCIISDALENDNDEVRPFMWSKPEWKVQRVPSEAALMTAFVESILHWDPDIIVGFEIEKSSIGYIVQRARELQRHSLLDPPIQDLESTLSRLALTAVAELSRLRSRRSEQNPTEQQARGARYMATHASDLSIVGRHCLNLWRIMRGEVKLNTYTPENVAQCVLQRHLPRVQHRIRTQWFREPRLQQRAVAYCVARARLSIEVLDQLDMIGRTSELARVFGIDFYSVLWRGSQYRVESMMLRLAHRHDPPFLSISPTKQQVASQRSLEVIPLVMEPSSRLYTSPVIVLDFRSLYPSVIIAYNLCYSTCLGKIAKNSEGTGTTRKRLGAVDDYSLPPGVLGELKGKLNLSPNEVMFAQRSTRQGILPRMLTEILEARIQVKKDLKKTTDPVVHRILNAKQYALKLIANVTYGYTSASFSGRMPCVDIADAIVAYGRETLESALRQIESNNNGDNPNWNAKVQYGDTDSLFVELPGRSKEEAFAIGAEMERAVNAVNPRPVELEMEKVYHPCILLSKKRYVGYSWESLKQTEPIFDAKGIETIRRDSCPLVAKMEEKALRILFESKDLSKIKRYCQRQWAKLLLQRVSMADLVFRREVKLGSYRSATNIPPAATVATKQMANDRMAEPRHGERVPFVVVYQGPAAPLRDCVVDPRAVLLPDSSLRINARYYIEKQVVPALARLLNIVGADVMGWWESMPRQYKTPLATMRFAGAAGSAGARRTIDAYYQSRECVLCFEEHRGTGHYCAACAAQPARLAFITQSRQVSAQRQHSRIREICLSCCASIGLGAPRDAALADSCVSLDCTVHYERAKAEQYSLTLQQLGAAL